MKLLLIALLASLSTASLATAQRQMSSLRAGTRVKLVVRDTVDSATGESHFTYPSGAIAQIGDGVVMLRQASTSSIGATTSETASVPLNKIAFAEGFSGMRRHTTQGAVAGLLVGGVLGYLFGDSGSDAGSTCTTIGGSQFCQARPATTDKRPATAAAGAALGAVVAGVIGHFVQSERWVPIDFASVRLEPVVP